MTHVAKAPLKSEAWALLKYLLICYYVYGPMLGPQVYKSFIKRMNVKFWSRKNKH